MIWFKEKLKKFRVLKNYVIEFSRCENIGLAHKLSVLGVLGEKAITSGFTGNVQVLKKI